MYNKVLAEYKREVYVRFMIKMDLLHGSVLVFLPMAGMVERSCCLSNNHKINELVKIFTIVVIALCHGCARR